MKPIIALFLITAACVNQGAPPYRPKIQNSGDTTISVSLESYQGVWSSYCLIYESGSRVEHWVIKDTEYKQLNHYFSDSECQTVDKTIDGKSGTIRITGEKVFADSNELVLNDDRLFVGSDEFIKISEE